MEVELKQKLQIRFKKTFLVVSRLDKRFGFDHSFFYVPDRKVGRLERNLANAVKAFFPEMYSEQWNI